MDAEKGLERDWSSLPPEVLNLIAKDLNEIPDFVTFRAVCTAWRCSTPVTDLPPQFPWILETWRKPNNTNLRFYSLSSDKFYTIPDPKSTDKWPYGISELSKGYLVTKLYDNSLRATHLSLINPLNNTEIPFPACRYQPYWFYHCPDSDEPELRPCSLGQVQGCRVNWDDMTRTFHKLYMKGTLFCLHRDTGFTDVTYMTARSFAHVKPPVGDHLKVADSTLLEAWGHIVGVFKLYNEHAEFLWGVYYLDVNESSSPCWVKIKNIGNHALFIDPDGVFMLKANDLGGIKANCIYCLYGKLRTDPQTFFYEVERIDIQTGAKEHCWSPPTFSSPVRWFVPHLHHLQKKMIRAPEI